MPTLDILYIFTIMEEAREDYPNLVEFLQRRLPELGLDEDTYGPYVLGSTTTAENNDDGDELEDIMQLLQASTDQEGLEDAVWEELTRDIHAKLKLDQDIKHRKEEAEREDKKAALQAKLEQAKLEQEQAKTQENTRKSQTSSVDDATKQAMLARFAYEQEDDDMEDDEEDAGRNINKLAAAQASAKEKGPVVPVATKREEQQKTKDMKANKQQAKEERRKRAVKGERKR